MEIKTVLKIFGIIFFVNLLEDIIKLLILGITIDRRTFLIVAGVGIVSTLIINRLVGEKHEG